jgi:hypothetical protein
MDIPAILSRKFKDSEWTLEGDDYSGLNWISETDLPTNSELEQLWPTVQQEIAQEKQAKEDSRLSAIAKLEALGLTVDEVEVAFGLTE